MENAYLIVGLGNPGAEYARTRHNVGFRAVEHLAERWRASWTYERKFNAQVARVERESRAVFLAEPQTYMNSSGEAVGGLVKYYHVVLPRLLVMLDDADLTFGQLRMRPGGSSGGHHGLDSIEQHLGSRDYARQRIGIGRQAGVREITGYVLGRFQSTELESLDKILAAASDQAECWLGAGIQQAMNRFNGAVEVGGAANERTEQ
jgi:PTH1 family peptidyl-tRNA hydrolase